jgi:hypothetical protein
MYTAPLLIKHFLGEKAAQTQKLDTVPVPVSNYTFEINRALRYKINLF